MSATLSIIIPVKNAGPGFRETLSAVFAQKEVPPFEVIVIDSGSTDGTVEFCRQLPVKILQIHPSQFSHGGTRNLGASLAKGEFLVFLVQDAVPVGTLWLKSLLDPLLENGRVAGAYSRQAPRAGASRRQAREMRRYYPPQGRLQSSPDDHTFSNVSSIIRRDVFDVIGFAPTEFGEDQLWARQVLEAGYLIQYQPDSVVLHSHDDGARTAFGRGRDEGVLSRVIHPGARPAAPLVIVLEALYHSAIGVLRLELKSCRYSTSMAAWHFGYRRGYLQDARDRKRHGRREIVYVTESSGYGGAEKYLLYLVDRARESSEVSVALPFREENAKFRNLLANSGVAAIDLPQYKALYPLNLLIALNFLVRHRRSLFHFSLPYPDSCRWILAAALLLRRRYLITEHLVPPDPFRAGLYFAATFLLFNPLKKLSYLAARRVITVSYVTRDILASAYGMPAGKMIAIHNGVDCELYRADVNSRDRVRHELRIPPDAVVITSVGRLAEQKGHARLISAVDLLGKEGLPLFLLVVGDGPLLETLRGDVRRRGMEERVVFAGFRDDIPAVLGASDVLVMTSLNEGVPLTILEAMSAGRPVIATDVGGNREAVEDSETGIVIPPEDEAALCSALRRIAGDSEERCAMGEKARQRAEAYFSKERMLKETFSLYGGAV